MKTLLQDLSKFSTHLSLSEREIQDAIRLAKSDVEIVALVDNLCESLSDFISSLDNWRKEKTNEHSHHSNQQREL